MFFSGRTLFHKSTHGDMIVKTRLGFLRYKAKFEKIGARSDFWIDTRTASSDVRAMAEFRCPQRELILGRERARDSNGKCGTQKGLRSEGSPDGNSQPGECLVAVFVDSCG
jgi:hypothetical protein